MSPFGQQLRDSFVSTVDSPTGAAAVGRQLPPLEQRYSYPQGHVRGGKAMPRVAAAVPTAVSSDYALSRQCSVTTSLPMGGPAPVGQGPAWRAAALAELSAERAAALERYAAGGDGASPSRYPRAAVASSTALFPGSLKSDSTEEVIRWASPAAMGLNEHVDDGVAGPQSVVT